METVPVASEFGLPVKPIKNLLALREGLAAGLTSARVLIAIIGAGPAGSEIAANLVRLLAEAKRVGSVALISAEPEILTAARPKRAGSGRNIGVPSVWLASRGQGRSRRRRRSRAREIRAGGVRSTYRRRGDSGATLLRESGLLCANDGSLRVNDFLQSGTHPEIFGAGDCIHFGERGLPRIGVYAVRQAPILAHNLRAYLAGEALKNFQPQKNYLLILNLGDGSALLTRGRWTIRNRPAFGSRTGSIAGSSGDFKSARGLVRRARLFRR